MTQQQDLATPCTVNFCPGCGDFGIWSAFKQAAVKADWNNSNTALCTGVGCHAHILNFIKITGFGSLHGRSVPVACGIKLANPDLNVFTFVGDGDCLAEGGNHFIHTCRRNHDITIIIHDNAIYGLTTGQTSPRTPHGFVTKSTPEGNIDVPVNPLALAITMGATFVARVYAGDIPKLADMIVQANDHRGIAIIDALQPCVTFNKEITHEYYQKNTYQLPDSYDPTNKVAAFEKSQEWGEGKIPVGVFYKENRPTYDEQIPVYKNKGIMKAVGETGKKDVSELFEKLV
jgi:2-oxoglutarate/2-oxoacid ferredoxin oxidoreductase subunit beta